jgi:peptide/nickel transport system permease protein
MKYILKKIIIFILTAWAALTVNFILPRMMPGNPVQVMLAKFQGKLNPEAVESLEHAFGLDSKEGIMEQYFEGLLVYRP